MKKHLIVRIAFVVSILMIAGCTATTPPPPTPTPTLTNTPEPTAPPTASPSPSPTPDRQPTPTQTLRTDGPYLAYLKLDGSLVLRDQDGSGATALSVPPGISNRDLPFSALYYAISPSGEWMAYCAGRPENSNDPDWDPGDFRLQLMHLPDGEIRDVTPLLSSDWPANFEEQAELLKASISSDDDPHIEDVTPEYLQREYGILCRYDWSADGRYLAFSGEMDGPSWDLYVYDTEEASITRLSSGIANVIRISWSPGGDYILHLSEYVSCLGGCNRWWIARSDGNGIWELQVPGNANHGWTGDDSLSVYTSSNGSASGYIYDVNVVTNATTRVWPHHCIAYASEPISGKVGITMDSNAEFSGGFYLYDPISGTVDQIFEDLPTDIERWGNGEFAFLVTIYHSGRYAVRADGSYVKLTEGTGLTNVSPDKEWVVFQADGIQLYTPEGETISVSPDSGRGLIWRLDSVGFYYVNETRLFYVPRDDPTPILIDEDLVDQYGAFPAWVP